jgi:hypothetical protein
VEGETKEDDGDDHGVDLLLTTLSLLGEYYY